MKKLIVIGAVLTALSAPAFAKTEGAYVGANILYAKSSHKYKNSQNQISSNYGTFDDSAVGYGVDFKYAFNYNKIFLAPAIFAEKIGTEAKDRDGDNVSINSRYGAKIDLGYDLTDKLAAYVTAGAANVSYDVDWKSINQKKSGSKLGALVGAGVIFHAQKNLALSLEYNFQSLDVNTPSSGAITKAEADINSVRFGLAYHF